MASWAEDAKTPGRETWATGKAPVRRQPTRPGHHTEAALAERENRLTPRGRRASSPPAAIDDGSRFANAHFSEADFLREQREWFDGLDEELREHEERLR